MLRKLLLCLPVCLFFWNGLPAGALAQEAQAPVSAEELESLVDRLEDPQARERLLADLKALIALRRQEAETPEEASPVRRFLDALGGRLASLGEGLATVTASVGDPEPALRWLRTQFEAPERREFWVLLAAKLLAVLAAAAIAAWLAGLLLRFARRRLESRDADSLWLRLPLLLGVAIVDLLPIGIFAVTAFLVLGLLQPDRPTSLAAVAAINAIVLARSLQVAARILLMPLVPHMRVFRLEDTTAAYLFVWARRFIDVTVYAFFAIEAAALLGLPPEAERLSLKLLGLGVLVLAILFILQNRTAVADTLRGYLPGRDVATTGVRRNLGRLAETWHIFAIFYLVAMFIMWVMEVDGGFLFMLRASLASLVVLALARFAVRLLHQAIRRLFAVRPELTQRYPLLEERANRYEPVAHHLAGALVALVAGLLILQSWGVDVGDALASPVSREILIRGFNILLVLAIALGVWELASILIARYLEARDEHGNPLQASARLRTLLPLIRSVLLAVVIVLVALTTLSELGVNIGPLLAGAGVVGLAIGFGAQTLVKDMITGGFILFEDLIAVGDIVTVGGQTGIVEGITMRTMRMRDLEGTVHTMPFSIVSEISNHSKDYSFALVDAGVAYREDTDTVAELLNQVGEEMRADPIYGPSILESLEIMGVQEFSDSAVVVRVRLKTVAGLQWGIRREFHRRMKRAFDAAGIEIPFPHRTIYFGEDKSGAAPPMRLKMTGIADQREEPERS